MLSCLSPRSPCCGPKAHATVMPSSDVRASSECTSSRVTDAGCARSAMRLPSSGLRNARSSSSRSIPNFIELERKARGVVKIRLSGRMFERPVRKDASLVFDHCAKRNGACVCGTRYARLELEPLFAAPHGDARIERRIGERRAFAVAPALVGRPLARRREIEFAVERAAFWRDENLAARVLPQAIDEARSLRRRHVYPADLSFECEAQRERSVRGPFEAHDDVLHGAACALRMAGQADRANGTQLPAIQKRNAKSGGSRTEKRASEIMRLRSVGSNSALTRLLAARWLAALRKSAYSAATRTTAAATPISAP